MNVILCDSSINRSNEDDKDQFCERLQQTIETWTGRDWQIHVQSTKWCLVTTFVQQKHA